MLLSLRSAILVSLPILLLSGPVLAEPDPECMTICANDGNPKGVCEFGCDEHRYIKTGMPPRAGREPATDPICIKDCMKRPEYGDYSQCSDMCTY